MPRIPTDSERSSLIARAARLETWCTRMLGAAALSLPLAVGSAWVLAATAACLVAYALLSLRLMRTEDRIPVGGPLQHQIDIHIEQVRHGRVENVGDERGGPAD